METENNTMTFYQVTREIEGCKMANIRDTRTEFYQAAPTQINESK